MLEIPTIVMGGSVYADIDVLACVAAYKQYLQLHGILVHALITGPWNQTIPSSFRLWEVDVEKDFLYHNTPCNFILVDFSDPNFIDSFVNINSVVEVFDHHYGYENYWNKKIGIKPKLRVLALVLVKSIIDLGTDVDDLSIKKIFEILFISKYSSSLFR